MDPELILMDEPFAALDHFIREAMQDELPRVFSVHKKSIIFVTHSIDEALLLGQKILVLVRSAPEFTVNKIGVTYVKSPLNVPSIIEKEKGIFTNNFSEYGLPVEYSNLTTGPEQTQALASGDIQFLYAVGALRSSCQPPMVRILKLSVHIADPRGISFVRRKDSTVQTASDLEGKKIAGPKDTILHELLVAYLATAGLTENDAEFVSMGIPDSQAALVGRTVDFALLAGRLHIMWLRMATMW